MCSIKSVMQMLPFILPPPFYLLLPVVPIAGLVQIVGFPVVNVSCRWYISRVGMLDIYLYFQQGGKSEAIACAAQDFL